MARNNSNAEPSATPTQGNSEAPSQSYSDWSDVGNHSFSGYNGRQELYNKFRGIADELSKLSGDELASATKKYSDEDLMRSYYCSTAFQDRTYRMFGYNRGDAIPEKDLADINKTIANGIKEAIVGKVYYVEESQRPGCSGYHETLRSTVVSGDQEKQSNNGKSLVGHEMAHGLYAINDKTIAPGSNSYYTDDPKKNSYGKEDAPVNLLGANGDDRGHDSAGVEQGANSSGLKVELTKLGIYNMFNSDPMNEEQYKAALSRFPENPLLRDIQSDYAKGTKMIGDIALVTAPLNLDALRSDTSNILASLFEDDSVQHNVPEEISLDPQKGISSTLASANFESELQDNNIAQSRGLSV